MPESVAMPKKTEYGVEGKDRKSSEQQGGGRG
jgi:hypothetical protein